MNPLDAQEEFEELWVSQDPNLEWIVYFTATWCGACKALDCDRIAQAAAARNIPVYKCDETINDYTSGFCGVKAFPTFMYFKPKRLISRIVNNNTADVIDWINKLE